MLNIDASSVPDFSSKVEPCLERITHVCTKETFTGRTAFSLFGLMMVDMVRLEPRHATQTAGEL
jgi:hypothetical protein